MIPKVRVTIPYIRAKKKKYLISKAKGKTKSNLEVFASGSVNIVNVTSLLFAIICNLFSKELVIASKYVALETKVSHDFTPCICNYLG